jgi:hypothetical protein
MLLHNQSIFNRFTWYFIVVIFGVLVDLSVFLTLSSWGFAILTANAAGFFLGALINIFLIRLLAFPRTTVPNYLDYMVTLIVNLILMFTATVLILILNTEFGFSLINSKLFANTFTLIFNFLIRNFLDVRWRCFPIFRKKR